MEEISNFVEIQDNTLIDVNQISICQIKEENEGTTFTIIYKDGKEIKFEVKEWKSYYDTVVESYERDYDKIMNTLKEIKKEKKEKLDLILEQNHAVIQQNSCIIKQNKSTLLFLQGIMFQNGFSKGQLRKFTNEVRKQVEEEK